MKQNNLYVFVAASLALLVPIPGRLAFGIIMLVFLNVTMLLGTLFRKLICVLKLGNLQSVLVAMMLVCTATMAKLVLSLFCPIYALVLGFALYLPALSSFLIGYFFDPSREKLSVELAENMSQSLRFSLAAFLLFLLRDIFGYGTITLPAKDSLFTIQIPFGTSFMQAGDFVASIPGTLVLVGLLIVFQNHITRKFRIAENVMENAQKTEEQPAKKAEEEKK